MFAMFNRRLAFAIALFAVLILAASRSNISLALDTVSHATLSVLTSDDTGMQLTLAVPPAKVSSDGDVTIAGLDSRFSQPGLPDLPFYTTLVALPPEAMAHITLSASGQSERTVAEIRPILDRRINEPVNTFHNIDDMTEHYEPDITVYGADTHFPAMHFELSAPMYIRDLRIVQLKLYPARYNPVTQTLSEVDLLDIDITFSGAVFDGLNPAAGETSVPTDVLNARQAASWRSLPTSLNAQETAFPIGKQTLKITVKQDGIYQITQSDLAAAGMDVASIDTATLEMMYQNEPVAYQFVGDSDGLFESDESIRFYGWAFDGTRHDRLYIGDSNVFWLWADGSPTLANVTSNASSGTPITEWRSTVELEEEIFYTTGGSLHVGDDAPDNEPEAWYMLGMTNGVPDTVSVDLPDPAVDGANATVLVEVSNATDKDDHMFDVRLNGTLLQTYSWDYWRNINLISSVSAPSIQDGNNTLELYSHHRNSSGNIDFDNMLVNRIQIEYDRMLTAVDNHLQFNHAAAGNHSFQIAGFTIAVADEIAAWNLTNRLMPTIVTLGASDIVPAAGSNTVNLSVSNSADSAFIVTADLMTPASLETYTASSLEPAGSSAEWVAIAHADFLDGAIDLAQHRATFSALSTHVVDVQDVYNQYGYGLAIPSAIQSFLTQGLANWGLQYGLLVGDATENPLKRTCSSSGGPNCPSTWSTQDENFVLTDFQFVDRWFGMIASDHTFATLSGDDELEDIAIGRLTGSTAVEIQNIVDKIKLFETALRNDDGWTQNMIWLADDADIAGDFCAENANVRQNYVTEPLTHDEICLDDVAYAGPGNQPTAAHFAAARTDFFNLISLNGARIISFHGLASMDNWAGDWIRTSDHWAWLNYGRPSVVLSLSSLDGNYAASGHETLSEKFLRLDGLRGTVANWSSSGNGAPVWHTALHRGFFNALYDENETRIGDAVKYSKNNFAIGDISIPYAYNLQGDPAMIVVNDTMSAVAVSGVSFESSRAGSAWPFILVSLLVLVTFRLAFAVRQNPK